MRTNPEPVVIFSALSRQSAVAAADLNAPYFTFPGQPKRGMMWILPEETKLLVRQLLDTFWQSLVTIPE